MTEVEALYLEIDEITRSWRQGDYFFEITEFSFRANPDHHIATTEKLEKDDTIIDRLVLGACLVSQTCDVVRSCKDRPYVEISPLIVVPADQIESIEKGNRPNYGFLPSLKAKSIVVDLDMVMTIEKSCLKNVDRKQGCLGDAERAKFGQQLARKRQRFAFPTQFSKNTVAKFRNKVTSKYNHPESPDGIAFKALREIRVFADPRWDADEIKIHFYFILNHEVAIDKSNWKKHERDWLLLMKKCDRFIEITGELTTLEIMSANEYVHSVPLDLDHLSEAPRDE